MVHAGADAGVPSRPTSPSDVDRLLRWICTSNPFYALSAVLFLGGLRLSVVSQPEAVQAVALMAGLAAYTLLLAVTAWGLVRFARAWDDVRTLLLLVVLMFLATSVTFDEVLVLNPTRGLLCFLAGLVFAIVVSEALLRGLGMKLPAWFRVPYYLILTLFFVYPPLLQPLLADPTGEPLQWGLFAFSTVAGLVFLTLLPAIRQGANGLRENGTPWAWPYYPWALFVILAIAVPGRAWLLCWSMQLLGAASGNQIVFGFYFLVPFGLALAILVLEAGFVSRQPTFFAVALSLPLLLLALAGVGHSSHGVYADFLGHFRARLGGDPLFVTLLAVTAFYAYAALRRAPFAPAALLAALATVAVVLLPEQTRRSPLGGVLLVHLVAVILLLLGLLRRDWLLARMAQIAGAGLLALVALATLVPGVPIPEQVPAGLVGLHPPLMAGLLFAYGLALGRRSIQALAGLILAGQVGYLGATGYLALRQTIPGVDYLALSLVLFAVAVLISLGKAGVLSRQRPDPAE